MNEQTSTRSNRISIVGFSLAIGLIIGVLAVLAIQRIGPQNEQSTQDVAHNKVEQTLTTSTNRISTDDRIEIGRFNEIFKNHSISEQSSALHATFSQATEQELKEWWNQSKSIERTSQREIAQEVILRSLAAINPQEAFRRIDEVSILQSNAALKIVFSEWAVLHLEDAINAAATLVSSRRIVATQAILETRDDLPENERLSIARQLESEKTFLRLLSDSKVSENIGEPERSWDLLLNDNVDDILQTETLAKVAEAWREQIGLEVLSKIYQIGVDDYRIRPPLVEAIAQEDPESALEYARNLTDEQEQSYLSEKIVRVWARTDAPAALSVVSTFEPASLVSALEENIAYTWARSNPSEMIENVESISLENRAYPLSTALSNVAREDPLGAIDMLSSVEHTVGNTSMILRSVVYQWAVQRPEAATDWVLENFESEDPQRRNLLERTLPRLAHNDPNKAFELAIEHPASGSGLGLDYHVLGEIVREGDIEIAKKLLPRVNERYKYILYGRVASEMVVEGQIEQALVLGEELEESNRRYYYLTVFSSWARTNPKNLMDSLDGLSTKTIKSIAAYELISQNRYNPVFTDDQLARVRTFLTPEDEASLKRLED
ncbi:MAG: hypothetical protein F4W92_08665 [Gammaproteobacteria bacterium]|nr:hypothetical protein [Gammaproteobacteria bacterium]